MIFEFIQWPVVFVAFCIGVSIVYITAPPPEFVVLSPTPERADKTVYEAAEGCYKYKPAEVPCEAKNRS